MRPLRVISLNMQHGWNTHVSPRVFITQRRILRNLENIVALIAAYEADIVLLQEVDRTSPLTRRLDQLSYVQDCLGMPHGAFGPSSEMRRKDDLMYSAGCGIISRYPLRNVENVLFDASFPTPRKGFLHAEIEPYPGLRLTLASVHLVSFDILKRESRHKQIERLAATLKPRHPLILGGDLNGTMKSAHVHSLVSQLGVTTHRIHSHHRDLHTFPAFRPARRIDWILASPHLQMADYRTLPHRVSDHRAVGATFAL